MFTQNKIVAAAGHGQPAPPRRHRRAGRGVVLNSGNANAATGAKGEADAERDVRPRRRGDRAAAADEVLVCSTGLIGYRCRWTPLAAGIPAWPPPAADPAQATPPPRRS